MRNLITIENNVLRIAPEALVIKEFHDIWKRDKTKTKDKALRELAYVYHTTDFQSIYRNYHPDIQESKIILDLFADRKWKPDSLIILAQEKYRTLQTTLSLELLIDAEFGLTKLRDYFRDVDFSEDENGAAAKNFIANVKQMGELVKGMKVLREEVEKELSNAMQLRGGSTIGRRELPPDRRG
jgi:hypothetical protein